MGVKAKAKPVFRVTGTVQATHIFLDHNGEGYADTSDATAMADDIAQGEVAYAKGKRLVGNIPVYDWALLDAKEIAASSGYLNVKGKQTRRVVYNQNATVTVSAPVEDFGNAGPWDVAKGKTFTSASGYLVEGIAEAGAGTISARGDGDSIIITTSAGVRSAGDDIIIGG